MPKKKGQFSYSSKIATNNNKGYIASRIRMMRKATKPPTLVGVGIKQKRSIV